MPSLKVLNNVIKLIKSKNEADAEIAANLYYGGCSKKFKKNLIHHAVDFGTLEIREVDKLFNHLVDIDFTLISSDLYRFEEVLYKIIAEKLKKLVNKQISQL